MPDDSATPIDGELTRLVPVTEADLDLLAGWFASPGFVQHWGGVPLSRAEVAAKYTGRRRPRVRSYLVLADDSPVGYAQYWYAAPAENAATEAATTTPGRIAEGGIDMVLHPDAQGRGLGPDATRALLAHLGGTLRWRRATVDPDATNTRAVRAWERAGFRRVERGEVGTHIMELTFSSAPDGGHGPQPPA
ncbi:GNAT family N-acetyltransferase [Streptomyces californicus]|uniref:GNAT family N-acetyltransferase n=1 Tax=Streptomyces californicus TaxID=67351 RepID=UPI0036B9B31F